jgi:uncharacterized protein YecA (UPF0149 family)
MSEATREMLAFTALASLYGLPDLDKLAKRASRSRGTWEPVTPADAVGRNDPCPCGSGRKYKKCCLNKPQEPKEAEDVVTARIAAD